MLWTTWMNAATKRCLSTAEPAGRYPAGFPQEGRSRRARAAGCRRSCRPGRGAPEHPHTRPCAEAVRRGHAPVCEGSVRDRREGRDREAAEAVREQDRRSRSSTRSSRGTSRARPTRRTTRGPNPYDVSYQTSTDLTVARDEGRPRGSEHEQVAQLAGVREDPVQVHPQHDQEEHVPGQALRPAVHHRRHRHLLQQGPAHEGRRDEDPDEHDRARRGGSQGQTTRRERLGPQRPADEQGLHLVLPLPRHPQPRRRHHLEGRQAGHLHIARGRSAATQVSST